MIGIYSITNIADGKRYIGQSMDLTLRLRKHKERLVSNRHMNEHLQSAFNKYGKDTFIFEVLAECAENQLDELECRYINHYQTLSRFHGYNMKTGGHNNHRASDELREKLSKAHKGKTLTPATRLKIGIAGTGKKRSPEIRKKFSEHRKGIVFSPEHLKNLSESHKGKSKGPHSEETKMKIAEAIKNHWIVRLARKGIKP